MLDAAEEAISFVQGKSRRDLDADRLLVVGWQKAEEGLPMLMSALELVFQAHNQGDREGDHARWKRAGGEDPSRAAEK